MSAFCSGCGKAYNVVGCLLKHLCDCKAYTQGRPWECPFDGCPWRFEGFGLLCQHVMNPYLSGDRFDDKFPICPERVKGAFTCAACGLRFIRKEVVAGTKVVSGRFVRNIIPNFKR